LERVIATLTTSFGLISTHPALSRDLNSLLQGFFSALLNLTSQNSLLPTILTALHILIPDHPSAFRPSLGQITPLILSIIDGPYSPEIKRLAAKVYVDLHHSVQKGANGDHWRGCLLGVIAEVHMVLDRVFEVVEEGTPISCVTDLDRPRLTISKGLELRPLDDEYAICLTSGMDRIEVLVAVMKEFLK